MRTFNAQLRVGPDAELTLRLPAEFRGADVTVTVTSARANGAAGTPGGEGWREFLDSVFGSIPDPTFERPPQGEFTPREPLD